MTPTTTLGRRAVALAALATVLVALLSAAGAAAEGAAAPAAPDRLAFTNVDVLPMDGGGALRDRTVLVEGDRIVAVGASGEVTLPPGTRTIDGCGRTLVPGLADMHVHLPPDDGAAEDGPARRLLAVMLANGVTTARSMAGNPAHLELRRRVEAGEVLGPSLVLAAPALHGGNTPDAEAAREAVRAARAAGYDLVKSHALEDPAVWAAVQDEAERQGLAVAGHVTNGVGLDRALAAGQQIEHLDGFVAALLPPDRPHANGPWGQIPPAAVLAEVDAARLPELARRVAASGAWNVPTLALFERVTDVETPVETLRAAPAMRYVSAAALDQWAAQRAGLAASGMLAGVPEPFQRLRRQIVAALDAAGAPLMAGSDSPQAFLHVGFGLHEELAALVGAGLTPVEALAAATANPARYLRGLPRQGSGSGRAADFGVVAPGSRADLVLLARSPEQDIAAARQIEGVLVRGRWLDRAALDAMLAAVAAGGAPKDGAAAAEKAAAPEAPQREGAAARILLVRHAEAEAGGGSDPELTAAGRRRAEALAEALAGEPIAAVLATDTRRARATAAPVAERLGLEVEIYDPRRLADLADALRRRGETVLVVGHSNTTPELVGLLGGEPGEPIGHHEHDRLYRVEAATGATTLERVPAPG